MFPHERHGTRPCRHGVQGLGECHADHGQSSWERSVRFAHQGAKVSADYVSRNPAARLPEQEVGA
jgi:hypothetical protein